MARIACPRCQDSSLGPLPFRASDGATDLRAATCAKCSGVWLDGADVARAYPRLGAATAHGAAMRDAAGAPESAIVRCPRCQGRTVEFPFCEVRLDWCSGCHGVWIDGLELVTVARHMERDRAAKPEEMHAGYRTAADRALASGLVACAHCGVVVALGDSLVTSDGTMCDPCGRAFEEDPALDLADVAALRRAGVAPEAAVRPRRDGFGAGRFLVEVLVALGAMLRAAVAPR